MKGGWPSGGFDGGAQHTIPVMIGGKPFVIFVDEGGAGGISLAQRQAACVAGLPPYPMARIIDISDETKPKIVSRLGLEVHDPANCAAVLPDLVGLSAFLKFEHHVWPFEDSRTPPEEQNQPGRRRPTAFIDSAARSSRAWAPLGP